MTPKAWLFLALGLLVAYYVIVWIASVRERRAAGTANDDVGPGGPPKPVELDRKSTRLNSSHT